MGCSLAIAYRRKSAWNQSGCGDKPSSLSKNLREAIQLCLPVGKPRSQTIETRRNPDLAAQPAVREAPCGSFVQRKILIIAYGLEFGEPGLIHIDNGR